MMTTTMLVEQEEELGPQRRCPRCSDYFPLDEEFFYRRTVPRGGNDWWPYCRACYAENRPRDGAARDRNRQACRDYYARNAEREKQKRRDWRAKKRASRIEA